MSGTLTGINQSKKYDLVALAFAAKSLELVPKLLVFALVSEITWNTTTALQYSTPLLTNSKFHFSVGQTNQAKTISELPQGSSGYTTNCGPVISTSVPFMFKLFMLKSWFQTECEKLQVKQE